LPARADCRRPVCRRGRIVGAGQVGHLRTLDAAGRPSVVV
jgi:hypothetical protein